MLSKRVIYAHGVHIGGGLTLLKEVFLALEGCEDYQFILDRRVKNFASKYNLVDVVYYESGIRGRLKSEWQLKREEANIAHILSFNSLPFLICLQCEVTIFFQNVNLLSDSRNSNFSQKVKSLVFRATSSRVDKFIVQSESVLRRLSKETTRDCKLGTLLEKASCQYLLSNEHTSEVSVSGLLKFIYIADASKHKNHVNLVKAWELLKSTFSNLNIELFFTLDSQSGMHWESLSRQFDMENLSIFNLGQLSAEQVYELYQSSDVLIFPSVSESLGLPLIEASMSHLDILAPELDYVRDVVVPEEVFNPESYISISRAIVRYLGLQWPASIRPITAQQLIEEVFDGA